MLDLDGLIFEKQLLHLLIMAINIIAEVQLSICVYPCGEVCDHHRNRFFKHHPLFFLAVTKAYLSIYSSLGVGFR